MNQPRTVVISGTGLLKEALHCLQAKGEDVTQTATRLATAGFEEFDTRIFKENPREVMAQYETGFSKWRSENPEEWQLSLAPHVYVRLRLAAKEYGKAPEDFAAMCLTRGIAKH